MGFDNHGKLKITDMAYGPNRKNASFPVKVQDLTFRDGHQSLFATRGRTEDMLSVAAEMDKVGFYSVEMWGGATFDTMHRFLNEDPWERIRTLKKHIVKTPFSMLLRGQNLVGYRNYADDIVEAFVQQACENGIDIFRVFDALNDFRNFQTAVKKIKANGKHFQGTICFSITEARMGGDVYTLEYYLEKARQLETLGADSICIKDMAGLLAPYDAYNLVSALKEITNTPIHLHTHFTSGMADLSLLKAIEAGVDIIDTCMSPFAYRSSHTAIEPLVVTLLGTNRDTGLDIEHLVRISERLEEIVPKYQHLLNTTKMSIIDTNVLLHQTPGGMLSNLVNQLKQMGELTRLEDVFNELPRVRKELGQVPLVTPTSQIVGTQTVNNVLFDSESQRYTKITEQVKDLCYGLYGKTPKPIDSDVQKNALKDYPRGEEPITVRPGEVLEGELEKARGEMGELAQNMDDLLICALFPVTGRRYLRWKYGKEEVPEEVKPKTLEDVKNERELIEKALTGKTLTGEALTGEAIDRSQQKQPTKTEALRSFDVFVDGQYYKVEVNEAGGSPRVVAAPPEASKPALQEKKATAAARETHPITIGEGETAVRSPMPGMIVSCSKQSGEAVKSGDTVIVVEAMKMNNNIDSSVDGVIKEIFFKEGSTVAKGDVLFIVASED